MTPAETPQPILKVRELHRSFGAVIALAGMDLDVHAGEIVAICGENGAGKSTLMRIMAGADRADTGTVSLRGHEVAFDNVRDAATAGISIVFQELSLLPDIDVLSNVAADSTPRRFGVLNRRAMAARAAPILAELGLDNLDLEQPLGRLTLSERQLLEIAKAVLDDAAVLILDEPNSALSAADTKRLFGVISRLRSRGVAVIYVSHRLEEVFRIADRIVVMRNGAMVEESTPSTSSVRSVVTAMIGRSVEAESLQRAEAVESLGEVRLALSGVHTWGALQAVDLTVAAGEVVGVAGLDGSGATEVFDLLFGLQLPEAGDVVVDGRAVRLRSPRDAVRAGVARVPADRRRHGVMLEKSLVDNVALVSAGALGRHGWTLNTTELRTFAADQCAQLGVKAASVDVLARQLSGGNQQKVVLAKWLSWDPPIVLLDDPTRGIDVGAKSEIYELVRTLADQGRAILFRSSEMREYEMTCDRVVLIRNGSAVAELHGEQISEHALLEGINAA